ncbi:hypothetical protein SEA_BRADISSA_75 [Gordonia phage Bradissa]|nr:hypothetical protein SEA_BRADISSA_75 [Gordonia phage Bradissa]
MRLTIRALGVTLLDIDLTEDDRNGPAGLDAIVTTQDAGPRMGFIPGHVEYDKPQPMSDTDVQ